MKQRDYQPHPQTARIAVVAFLALTIVFAGKQHWLTAGVALVLAAGFAYFGQAFRRKS